MLEFGLYSEKNEPFFEDIFEKIFRDKKTLDFFHMNCFSEKHTYVASENGRIYSVISLIPEKIFYSDKEYSSLYLFHFETIKSFRKMGFMKKLFSEMLDEEKKRGFSYIFACPKGIERREYLLRKGFIPSFSEGCLTFSKKQKGYGIGKELSEHHNIRNEILKGRNRVLWRESELEFAGLLGDKTELDEKLFANYKINGEYGAAFEFLCDIENLERLSNEAMERLSLSEMSVLYPETNLPTYMAHLNPIRKKLGIYKKLSENAPDFINSVYLGFPI